MKTKEKKTKDNKDVGANQTNKRKSKRKLITFIITSVLIVSAVIFIYIFFIRGNIVEIDGKKYNVENIIIKVSEDKKYINSTSEKLMARLKYKYEYHDMFVNNVIDCGFKDYKYCQKIIVENDTTIYAYSNKKDRIEGILFESKSINPVLGFVDFFVYLTEDMPYYNSHYLYDNFTDINSIENEEGMSYILDNIRMDWKSNKEEKSISITLYPTSMTFEEFKNSEEYADQSKKIILSKANNEIKQLLSNEEELVESKFEGEGNLSYSVVKCTDKNITKVICAENAREFAVGASKTENVGTLQYDCYDGDNKIFSAVITNIKNITSQNVEENMNYFDANGNKQNVTIESLKQNEIQEFKNSCEKLSYKDVLRTPEQFEGRKAYWFGEVVQVVGSNTYRVDVNCKKYQYISGYSCEDTIYVEYNGDTRLIEDDMVKIYGSMDGTQTYTTVLGASVTVPKVSAKYIDIQ